MKEENYCEELGYNKRIIVSGRPLISNPAKHPFRHQSEQYYPILPGMHQIPLQHQTKKQTPPPE